MINVGATVDSTKTSFAMSQQSFKRSISTSQQNGNGGLPSISTVHDNTIVNRRNITNSKQVLGAFAIHAEEVDVSSLQQAVRDILHELERVESENRMLRKENEKHIKMLEINQISVKLKDSYFQEIVSHNIEIKAELEEMKLQKVHMKHAELIKLMKSNDNNVSPRVAAKTGSSTLNRWRSPKHHETKVFPEMSSAKIIE